MSTAQWLLRALGVGGPRRTGEVAVSSCARGGRKVHVRAVGRLVGPARGYDLAARVELHALGAVDVVVAEQRVLPAAEAVEAHRHGDRDVDADHADLDAAPELARRVSGAGEDRR